MPSPDSLGPARALRYAHVLVDFDRTLNDSDAVYQQNLDGFFGLTGRQVLRLWEQVHREVLKAHPQRHEDLDLHYERMLRRLPASDVATVKQTLRDRIKAAQQECWHATRLFEESIPFLSRMKDAGYVLHLATGDYAKLKAQHIERQAGRSLFDGTFDEETLGVGKGKRDYFDRVVERLGVAPGSIVMVGDSLKNDIAPGIGAGLATVWVRRKGERNRGRLRPDLVVKSLTAALPHFLHS